MNTKDPLNCNKMVLNTIEGIKFNLGNCTQIQAVSNLSKNEQKALSQLTR